MRVLKTRWFRKFAARESIEDEALCDVVERAEQGLIDADLGGSLIKQRVARRGQGRSGGYRTIIVYRSAERSVFVYGFAKSKKADLTSDELKAYRRFAAVLLAHDEKTIQTLILDGELTEIACDV